VRVLKILLIIQVLAILFLLVPYSIDAPNNVAIFPFNESLQMPLRSYFWILGERLGKVLFYLCIFQLIERKYVFYVFLFLCMEGALVVEYLLSYNKTWFSLPMVGMIGLSHFFIIFKALILTKAIWEQSK